MQINIDKEFIREAITAYLEAREDEHEIGDDLIEEVFYSVSDDIGFFVEGHITKVIDFNNLVERNKSARDTSPHYRVDWKNENVFQREYITRAHFLNLEDAKEYIHYDIITEFDQWRVFLIEPNNITEVYAVN